jgi:hypothetical protein
VKPKCTTNIELIASFKYLFGGWEGKHYTLFNIAIIAIYYPASTIITTLAHDELPTFREEPIRPS